MSLLIPELERQLRAVVHGRLESHGATPARTRRRARVVLMVAAVVPALAIGVVAVALLGRSGKRPSLPASRSVPRVAGLGHGVVCDGRPGAVSMDTPIAGVARFPEATAKIFSSTIAGFSWSLRAKAGELGLQAIQDGRLILDGHAYGMCGPGASSPAVEMIDKPGHAVVYGYVIGRGRFSVSVRGRGGGVNGIGATTFISPVPGGGGEFLIGALPASACRYRSVTLSVSQGRVAWVNVISPTACRLGQPVPSANRPLGAPISSSARGGPRQASPVATIKLHPPAGTGGATGTFREISQSGVRDITITASGLNPNTNGDAYAVWLYESPSKARMLGFVPGVRRDGHLETAGVLPKGGSAYREILITLETRPNPHTPGPVVLAGTGRIR